MKKIIIVNTSSDFFGDHYKKTGLWFGELVHFYDYFNDNNYEIDIYNISGGNTPIDPVSLSPAILDKTTKAYYKNQNFMDLLKYAQPISEANLTYYDCIYFTGGHGVMYDFTDNEYIQEAVKHIYNNGGIVAAVCHGIAALVNVKNADGRFFIDNKEITSFSNTEELLANRSKYVPYKLETKLKSRGAKYSKAKLPFRPFVKVRDRLVTGQNPQSSKQVAQAIDALWRLD